MAAEASPEKELTANHPPTASRIQRRNTTKKDKRCARSITSLTREIIALIIHTALNTVVEAVVAKAPPVVAAIKDVATKEAEEATTMEDAAIKAVVPVAMGTNPITMVIGTTMV